MIIGVNEMESRIKIGLLKEPKRSQNGYPLYGAAELTREADYMFEIIRIRFKTYQGNIR